MRPALGPRVLLAALLLGPPLTARAGAQGQGFAETAEVVAVEVPVQVFRDGEPVRGLTADDFEVYEGRKRMPITGFETVDLEAPATAARAATVPAAARRHFLLLFDLSFSDPQSIAKAREAARDLVLGLHSADLVAVATYHAANGPNLVLGFTSDRRQVDSALTSLGLNEGKPDDPLRLVLKRSAARPQASSPTGATTAAPDYAPGSGDAVTGALQQLSDRMDKSDLESQKRAVTALTRSFADLARVLGSVQGRKHVVYLSEGYDSRLLQGSADEARLEEMAAASASGEIWSVGSEDRYGSTTTLNDVERMLEELRRADCVVQAVDIGGLRAGAELGNRRAGGRDSLFQMAHGTGGELYENLNDLSSAMDRMLERTGVTYVLAFQPERLRPDGSYHKVRVELKNGKGARVVHRPGYYAPRPYAERNPFERLLEAGTRVLSAADEAGPVGVAVLAAPFWRSAAGTSYVPVVIEVDGPSLLAGMQPGPSLPAEIYVYAFDDAGAIPDFLTQTLGLDLSKVEPALRQSGLKFFGHLDLPPGSYSLRVLVRNGATGGYGLRVAPLEVEDPSAAAAPVLLPPLFPEAPGKWLMAREAVPAGEKAAPYPFLQGDQPYIPSSRPVLALGEAAPLSLVGYNLAEGELQVRSQVLSAGGRELGPGEIQVLEREPGTPARLKGTFRPPRLEPGEYVLQVTLAGADGTSQSSATPFVIGKKTS